MLILTFFLHMFGVRVGLLHYQVLSFVSFLLQQDSCNVFFSTTIIISIALLLQLLRNKTLKKLVLCTFFCIFKPVELNGLLDDLQMAYRTFSICFHDLQFLLCNRHLLTICHMLYTSRRDVYNTLLKLSFI